MAKTVRAEVAGHQERSTPQKRALAAVLENSAAFRSAQDLHAELRRRGERVGLTTVYNQLKALVEAGEIDVLRVDEGETRYRRCLSDEHHHHLLCRRCGRTIEIEGDEVERWAERIASTNGFVDISHTVEVVGTCQECARRGPDIGTAAR